MPRKTKSGKGAKAQPTLTENEPQPTLTEGEAAAAKAQPKDRGPGGRFAIGNPGGPGNPHARSCARMLEVFRNAISEEDMIRIVQELIEKASAGDTSAAKIIVAYRIGKPLPASHPDTIDRNEWDHYQQDAMNDKEMAVVMNSLPTRVGNDVARISLPIMTAARTHELAMQLREGLPTPEPSASDATDSRDVNEGTEDSEPQHQECERVETNDERREGKSAPLPNGKKNEKSKQRATAKEPLANGKMGSQPIEPSAPHTPPATPQNADGKKTEGKKMKKRRASWLQPLAKQLNSK